MAPERSPKRVKPNPSPQDEIVNQDVAPDIQLPAGNSIPAKGAEGQSEPSKAPDKQEQRSSWYGTWPRKAAPVTQVDRESISSASNAATEAIAAVTQKLTPMLKPARSGSLQVALGKTTSNRSVPADAAITKIHATPESSTLQRKRSSKTEAEGKERKPDTATDGNTVPAMKETTTDKREDKSEDPQANGAVKASELDQSNGVNQDAANSNSTWLRWISKPLYRDGQSNIPTEESHEPTETQEQQPLPQAPIESKKVDTAQQVPDQDNKTPISTTRSKRGWLNNWKNETTERPSSAPPMDRLSEPLDAKNLSATTKSLLAPESIQKNSSAPSKASSIEVSAPPALPGDGSKSAGWVFWSRDRKTNTGSSTPPEDQPHFGEIAISNTPSQKLPRRASIRLTDQSPVERALNDVKERPQSPTPSAKDSNRTKVIKGKAASSTMDSKAPGSKSIAETTKVESSKATATGKPPEEVQPNVTLGQAVAAKKSPPNLLLPPFRDTIHVHENPSIIEQISRLLYYTSAPQPKHLSLVRDPPRIKNVLAIGVHGYFPAPLIRTVLGQPTGTSIKFADMTAKSIRKWTKARGYECEVKTAALEGEGRIAERIELLWKLLLNWIDEVRKADFVMIACHSQGVPVALMLVAKLIHFGCVNSARVGICAMAGVCMGPFMDYKSRWISGTAGELFEFSDPTSKVSTDFLAAVETVLKFGVKLSFIGSIDDQLVSLESSLYTPISHPHIYRAVQIDSRVHAPNFLSHLVGFALKLRNLGVPDHGLIRELSSPLAGSLYTSEGHSRIYEDDAVYDLAIAFTLETNSLNHVNLTQRPSMPGVSNPYILPFAMRGILEEDFVKTEMQSEAHELLKQFDDWRPTTKVLKDVKFRLEGIRSKL